ncbi:hypothetical protein PR003_g11006 [Phytophthora rubi]|uniref:Uncharacterized protein n=1 Tax=Phytophthora rubi TaxID=129364 RepID=A0A6A4F9H6_9STRA|nr:hypothetical protein PR002_g11815 [Phytophthora rubi]KAE9029194.1 hypothetical protein PR001_g11567 [Phytophthora rubi]KAE9339454.1 hypothetical protein PR003_g11006 [Phytophthora rubi]
MSGVRQQRGSSGGTSGAGHSGGGGQGTVGVQPSGGGQQVVAQQGDAGRQAGGAHVVLRGTNKPPQYTEDGGFDLFKAQLRSYLTQRDCWGIVSGRIQPDPNDAARQQIYEEKNTFVCDALLRGLL